jgi:hypothetical protein
LKTVDTTRVQLRLAVEKSSARVAEKRWCCSFVELRVHLWNVNQQATEAEESPLLRFVTRKRLVKTLQRNSHCGEICSVEISNSVISICS